MGNKSNFNPRQAGGGMGFDPALAAMVGGMGGGGGPSQAEQRRVAALQFALASRPDGFKSAEVLISTANAIDTFIQNGAQTAADTNQPSLDLA